MIGPAREMSPEGNLAQHRTKRVRIIILFLGLAFVLAAGVIALRPGSAKVYGNLSPKDVAEIRSVHRTLRAKSFGPGWYQRSCPVFFRRCVAGALNPIEGIYVQENGWVIVNYRSANKPAYDIHGKRRWGREHYRLAKGPNGWAPF